MSRSSKQKNSKNKRSLLLSTSRRVQYPIVSNNEEQVVSDKGLAENRNVNIIVSGMALGIALIIYLSIGGKKPPPPDRMDKAKILGLVGVQTTYLSPHQRAALRSTWFPANRDAHISLRRKTSLAFVFVIGKTKGQKWREIEKENEKYGDIMILKVGENVSRLKKTMAFFISASKKFDAEYYIKAEHDIYLRPDRLATVLSRKMTKPLEYIGCKKSERIKRRKLVYAHESIYILSATASKQLAKVRTGSLPKSPSDDLSIGYAMDSMCVELEEQKDLCHSNCTPTSIAVWNFSCPTGPCDIVTMLKELHESSICSRTPTIHSEVLYTTNGIPWKSDEFPY